MRFGSSIRLMLVIFSAILVTAGLAYKLATIQFLEPERYREWGASQRIRGHEIAAHRGEIVDRNGVTLAVSHPQTTLWADPRLIEDPRAVAAALGSLLEFDQLSMEQRLSGDGAFAYIARQQPDEVAEAVLALELAGVFSYAEHARFNPSGENLARAVIGRAGLDHQGISGLEKQYGDVLVGEPGWVDVERGNDGSTIPGGVYEYAAPEPGSTLVLSLDRSLQYEAERQLIQQVRETDASGGVALVGNPETGEILAMANVTRTDEGAVVSASANLATTWVFEPGSVFKPVTISGLVDVGAVSPAQWFDLPRSIVIYDKEFIDEHREGDRLQLKHILANSSNVGTITAARVGEDLHGPELEYDTMRAFGFGERSQLDFPGESAGILPDVDDWSGLSLPTMAIGQGVAVTPVQMLSAYMTLANDGVRAPLTLLAVDPLDETTDDTDDDQHEPIGQRVVSERTARAVTDMLVEVVHADYGTGSEAVIAGYTAAGKTGTAWQILEDGTYGSRGNRHRVSSFAGFVPADDPAIVVYVALDNPIARTDDDEANASKVAAPLFADVAQFALRRAQIPPAGQADALEPLSDERVRSLPAIGTGIEPWALAADNPGASSVAALAADR